MVAGRQDEGNGFLFFFFSRYVQCCCGGISCPAMVGEEIFHRFGKTLVAEALEEADGVSTHFFRITKPCAAVFDANAVHLFRGVVVANPLYLIAQVGQQVR